MRLDHLLSKEPTARFGHVCCPVAGKFLRRALAYGCHEIPSTPAHQPAELSGAFGRAVAGTTELSGARPSLLCFEEAASDAAGPRARRPRLFAQPGRTGDAAVELSSGPVVPPPRDARRLGRVLENCIASTSVLLTRCGPRRSAGFPIRRGREDCAISSYKEPTVDALAPDADEGRGWLRKATGSCLPSFDPWISEWGNPAGVMPSHSCLNT